MPSYDVKCPRCAERAAAEMWPDGVRGTYREAFVNFVAHRVSCGSCGLVRASDSPLPYELWFKVAVGEHVAWAHNRDHAVFLVGYLSNRSDDHAVDRSSVETLPGWMLEPKNRAVVVQRLQRMIHAG